MPPPPPIVDGGQQQEPDTGMPPGECMGSGDGMCTRPNADAVCVDTVCLIVRCAEAYRDCDGSPDNGCEATLDSADHCGACGASCRRAHVARSRCAPGAEGGPCFIDRGCAVSSDPDCVVDDPGNGCEEGFGDCDGKFQNGCETSLRTLTDCGHCGMRCASAEAEVSCATGQCVEMGCAPGHGDCREQGCQNLASDTEHCGECGNACRQGLEQCHGGRCTRSRCSEGTADCDDDSENGCETELTTVQNCGSCGVACGPYPHAQPGCAANQCVIAECDPGFADCDTVRDNGCEVDVRTPQTCGSCVNDCSALPHVVSSQCSAQGECTDLVCEPGWEDCDGEPENGCEQSLSTLEHCGACNRRCARANAVTDCSTGMCTLSTCEDGFDDCNGQPDDGCEASLQSEAHCGGCGNACMTGAICRAGGCACGGSGGCPQGSECCDGVCVNTRSDCFPWPCIPGTNADEENCGACGRTCWAFCCLVL